MSAGDVINFFSSCFWNTSVVLSSSIKIGEGSVEVSVIIPEISVKVQIGCVVGICSPMVIPRQLKFSLYSGAVITEDWM